MRGRRAWVWGRGDGLDLKAGDGLKGGGGGGSPSFPRLRPCPARWSEVSSTGIENTKKLKKFSECHASPSRDGEKKN